MHFSTKATIWLVVLTACLLPHPPVTAFEPPRVKVEFRRAESKPANDLTEATVVGSDRKVYLHKNVEISNADIDESLPGISDNGEHEVCVRLTKQGAEKMAKLTKAWDGKPLAILVDGKVVCAPLVQGVITTHLAIRGSFTAEEAARIAQGINAK